MTVNDAFEFTLALCRKDREGRLRPDQWNIYAGLAEMAAINTVLPYIKTNPEMRELLLPLLLQVPVTAGGNSIFTMPADLLHLEAVSTADAPNVDFLTFSEFSERSRSVVVGPEAGYPIGQRQGNNFSILPASITQVTVGYVRKPKGANWDYTIVNNEPVFNASATPAVTGKVSQGFEVSDRLHEQICARIVLLAGYQLSNAELVQYGLQGTTK